MSEQVPIRDGQILTGTLVSGPMRVETTRSNGTQSRAADLVGTKTEQFRKVSLSARDITNLTVTGSSVAYDADGRLPRLGLSISRMAPLLHQLEAVHGHLLKFSTVRFLLADDAGEGKMITALQTLIVSEQDRSPDFPRLFNALSAPYPWGSREKRLLDAMLLAVPR